MRDATMQVVKERYPEKRSKFLRVCAWRDGHPWNLVPDDPLRQATANAWQFIENAEKVKDLHRK